MWPTSWTNREYGLPGRQPDSTPRQGSPSSRWHINTSVCPLTSCCQRVNNPRKQPSTNWLRVQRRFTARMFPIQTLNYNHSHTRPVYYSEYFYSELCLFCDYNLNWFKSFLFHVHLVWPEFPLKSVGIDLTQWRTIWKALKANELV